MVASIWYAVAPPRSQPTYRSEAVKTVGLLYSDVQTAKLWIDALAQDQVTQPAATVAFLEAESDANSQGSTFAGYDPPAPVSVTEQVRTRVAEATSATVDVLAAIRIAAKTEQWDRLPALRSDLTRVATQLETLKAELSR